MTRRWLLLLALALPVSAAPEPLIAKWLLKSQEVSGQETPSRPLTLDIRAQGDGLEFEYSVTTGSSRTVSLRFVARLDGSPANVQDAQGRKIGSAKVLRGKPLEYALTLEGPNRPTASGKMTLSTDRKTLICESDSTAPGGARTHTVQVFTRQ